MKKSEIRKIIFEYKFLKSKSLKNKYLQNDMIKEKINQLAQKYYHEIGESIERNKEISQNS